MSLVGLERARVATDAQTGGQTDNGSCQRVCGPRSVRRPTSRGQVSEPRPRPQSSGRPTKGCGARRTNVGWPPPPQPSIGASERANRKSSPKSGGARRRPEVRPAQLWRATRCEPPRCQLCKLEDSRMQMSAAPQPIDYKSHLSFGQRFGRRRRRRRRNSRGQWCDCVECNCDCVCVLCAQQTRKR